jgi:hypothetical protein
LFLTGVRPDLLSFIPSVYLAIILAIPYPAEININKFASGKTSHYIYPQFRHTIPMLFPKTPFPL